jgi:hypothetical protein
MSKQMTRAFWLTAGSCYFAFMSAMPLADWLRLPLFLLPLQVLLLVAIRVRLTAVRSPDGEG